MAVLAICKFFEDPIKIEGTIGRTRLKMKLLSSGQHCLHYMSVGKIFIAQGQETPTKIVRSGPKSNISEIL